MERDDREIRRACEKMMERKRKRAFTSLHHLTSKMPLASTPALFDRKLIKASVGSSAVKSITALCICKYMCGVVDMR